MTAGGQAPLHHEIILYVTPDGAVRVEVLFEGETFWLTQKKMAELFGVNLRTVNEHLKNIFATGELEESATIRKNRIVQIEGTRTVSREMDFYNLDAIIAVRYRVNSREATQFRIWATQVLREYLVKGFVLDDERLKQGKHLGKNYFDDCWSGFAPAAPASAVFISRLRTSTNSAASTTTRMPKSRRCSSRRCRTNCTGRLPAKRQPS